MKEIIVEQEVKNYFTDRFASPSFFVSQQCDIQFGTRYGIADVVLHQPIGEEKGASHHYSEKQRRFMSKKSVFIFVISLSLTYTIAHANIAELDQGIVHYDQKIYKYHSPFIQTPQTRTQHFISPQSRMTPSYTLSGNSKTLSIGGVSIGFHTGLGTDAPFIGAFGYHREPVDFTHTGQQQTVNLGWLGGIEYTDATWGGSFLGLDTQVDAEIFLISGMVGTDIQTPDGVLIVGAGFSYYTMTLGVGVELFGIRASSLDEYSGFTPTALIAYTFHTVTNSSAEAALTFSARYQGEGFMVNATLGVIAFD